MTPHLRILHLEDLPTDAELVERELKKGKIEFDKLVVDNKEAFIKALDEFSPDIILSDHSLPSFNSTEALQIVKDAGIKVPFILITATMSEEFAVEVMKSGTSDYILKDRLQRLPQAIKNAMEKYRFETEREQFLERVVANETLLKETEQLAIIGSFKTDLINNKVQWSAELRRILGYENDSIEPSFENLLKRVHPDDAGRVKTELEDALVKSNSLKREFRLIMDDGTLKHIRSELVIERNNQGQPVRIRGFNQDITAQKTAEQKIIKANRLYSFISAINQSIVHITDEQELLDKVCDIAVGIGRFKAASIMLLDEKNLLTVLSAKGDDATTNLIKKYSGLSPSDPLLTNTNAGQVFITGEYVVKNDSLKDPVASLKDTIIKHGIKSNISFPIKKFGKIIGVFSLISAIKNFFDGEEIALLEEAASDISFALEVIEKDKQRRQAELQLVQNEIRLNKAQSIAHIGHSELNLATGVASWSEETCRIYGLEPSDTRQSFEVWASFIHPDDKDFVMNKVKDQRQSLNNASFDYRISRRNGTIRNVHVETQLVLDSSGKPIMLYGVTQDITEQKIAEEKIIESEKRFREFFDSAPEAITVLDLNTFNFIKFNDNARNLLKYKEEQLLKMGPQDFSPEFQPDGRRSDEKARELITAAINGGKVVFEWLLTDADGKDIMTEARLVSLSNINGPQLLTSFIDISERKEEERMREKITADIIQRNKDLEQFSYIVSHNLRAPVANIMGLTDLINSLTLDEENRKNIMQGLNISAHRLDSVIMDLNQILQVRRQVEETREPVCFSEVLNDIKLSIDDSIKKEKVNLEFNFAEMDSMHTLKSYIYSIFYNLITNSIKYKRPGIPPEIEITTKKNKNRIEITFKDNGMGIDLNKSGKDVFGLYKRFHNQAEGKGMGLYMVKTQVEALGGKINISSEVNKGTEFKIEFDNFE